MKAFGLRNVGERKVILWGGTMYGEIAYKVITQMYQGKIEAVIDNKYTNVPWMNGKTIRSSELCNYKNVDLIICAANAFEIIRKEALKYQEYLEVYDMREILQDYKALCQGNPSMTSSFYMYGDIDIDEVCERYNYYAGVSNDYMNKLYLPYCVLCVTTKCSLKCRDCAAFITKYKQHVDYDSTLLTANFSKILSAVDGIIELEIMGGEPFLYSKINEILEWCIAQSKIHAIKIVTNGTIVPKESTWKIMQSNKVKLVVDDYGEVSRNFQHVIDCAKGYGVRYEKQQLQTWYKLTPIVKKNQVKEQLEKIYNICNFKTCIGMTNGKFYHCNVAGHMMNAGLIPKAKQDYIQIDGVEWKPEHLRKELKSYLNCDYMEACDYCNYCSCVEIPVAEQETNHNMRME